jgi:hypothetical protein
VVGIGRMPHPEDEPEKQKEPDVQDCSRHGALFKMASLGNQADPQDDMSTGDCRSIRANPMEGWGEP